MKRLILSALFLFGIVSMAYPENVKPTLVAGMTISQGLGEQKYAPYAEVRVASKGWQISGQGELSRKVETGKGYRAGLDVERSFGLFILTAGGRYRTAGTWQKKTAWGGVGVGTSDVRLVLRRELPLGTFRNETTSATLTLAHGPVEAQFAGYSYLPTHGGERQFGSTVLVAYRMGK
jgi:hypothetical protein